MGERISLYEMMPGSSQTILCLLLCTSGALFISGRLTAQEGRLKEDNMMSCLESTYGFALEQRTSRIISFSRILLWVLWRITSMEEEIFPVKWW